MDWNNINFGIRHLRDLYLNKQLAFVTNESFNGTMNHVYNDVIFSALNSSDDGHKIFHNNSRPIFFV